MANNTGQKFENTQIFAGIYWNSSHSSPMISFKWYKGKWLTTRG